MTKTTHRLVLATYTSIVLFALIFLIINGMSYYGAGLEDRVYHADHQNLKPSGILGHGLGITGTLLILIGISSYMARKRYRFLSRIGSLKYWLDFHIFLCTLGPVLVLFHTAYKFGGLVAISFWSMVAVFISGIIGRFIYLQIPRTIEGREMSLAEIRDMKSDIAEVLRSSYNLDEESYNTIIDSIKRPVGIYHSNPFIRSIIKSTEDRRSLKAVKTVLLRNNLPGADYRNVIGMVNHDIRLNRKIDRLEYMQNLFRYWHVAHLPFALVMLIIMLIHVAVTILFGYRWIF